MGKFFNTGQILIGVFNLFMLNLTYPVKTLIHISNLGKIPRRLYKGE